MDIETLKRILRRHEGMRLDVYLDTQGYYTIGYGRKLEAPIPKQITMEQAEEWLDEDARKAVRRCELFIHAWDTLDDIRQVALADMCFNLGIGGLLRFGRMLAAIYRQDWQEAHDEVLASKYARQVGRRADEIADMILTGVESGRPAQEVH